MQIAIQTGYRIDDILHIRCWQIGAGRSTLRLKEAKTGHYRTVSLEPCPGVRYKQRRGLDQSHAFAYFFPAHLRRTGQQSRKLHRSTFYRHFTAAVVKAGLQGKGYTVHSLRKVYARNLYRKLGSVSAVQRDLGHSKIETTLLYLSDLDL